MGAYFTYETLIQFYIKKLNHRRTLEKDAMNMRCLSRVTDNSTAQHFADQRHKFYLESRCGRPTLPNTDVCIRCSAKIESCTNQNSRSFLHGKVYELIPPKSHLYGGPWYMEGVRKWGAPSSDRVEYAKQFQTEARGEYVVMPQGSTLEKQVKAMDESVSIEMPRAKKEESDKPRKPKIGKQKPVVGEVAVVQTESVPEVLPENQVQIQEIKLEPEAKPVPVKTRKPRKKPEIGPSALLPLHKEVVLPTHIESTIEEFDTDGFEIEYVRLSTFEHESQSYFRDSKKNKLYKKIKEKTIGSYVGRYDPDTNMIHTDVPDSDSE